MYCNNCGNICKDSDIYCEQCGHSLPNQRLNNVSANSNINDNLRSESDEDNKRANQLGVISFVCLVLPFVLDKILIFLPFEIKDSISSSLSGMSLLTSITLMIFIRIKYPNNVLGKVLMWLCIIGFIFWIICALIIMIACVSFLEELKNCPG